jgi:rhodanese-related sulfurtransferase
MNKTHKKLMVVCSLMVISAIAAIYFFKLPVSNVAFGLVILLYPLSHLLMMKFMGHDHYGDHHQGDNPNEFGRNSSND